MSSCTSCGHQLGVGRFCTNCGAPVDAARPDGTPVSTPVVPSTPSEDWRTDTAERRLSPADPRTPPSAVAPPPPPRYPLYADEVPDYSPYAPLVATSPVPAPPEPAVTAAPVQEHELGHTYDEPYDAGYQDGFGFDYQYTEERRSPVLWILVAAAVLALVGAGWWFLVRDDGSAARDSRAGASAQDSPSAEQSDGTDVASRAAAKAPKTAPPNEDVNGDQVSYDASNMLDGVPETAWRAPGDASGMTLTFTLREPTELHRVGLVNGYAKTSTDAKGRTFDWYLGNRRVLAVMWVFDDGSKVPQRLTEDRQLQTVEVPDVVTGKVSLRIVKVSPPGEGDASRDFTAISEVSLVGDPQG